MDDMVDVTKLTPAVLRALVLIVKHEDECRPRMGHYRGIWPSWFARLMWPNSPAWGKHTGNRSGLWQRAGGFLWKLYKMDLLYNDYDSDHGQNFWIARVAARKAIEAMTCYKCPHDGNCPVAWDSYNINGECLNK